jgi:hypothetical protein
VEGLVIIQEELAVGAMVPMRITGAMEYDLLEEAVSKTH